MIRFLADACLRQAIVKGCLRREPSMDFLGANAAKLEGIDDSDVLALAARYGRVFVTSDLATMPGHFSDFLMKYGSSPGVFLVSQRTSIGEVIDALLLIWAASDAEDWANKILEVPF